MKHTKMECKDDPCNEEHERDRCNVCNLFICSVCGGAEGSLTTDCCGRTIQEDEAENIMSGKLDYTVADHWIWKKTEAKS